VLTSFRTIRPRVKRDVPCDLEWSVLHGTIIPIGARTHGTARSGSQRSSTVQIIQCKTLWMLNYEERRWCFQKQLNPRMWISMLNCTTLSNRTFLTINFEFANTRIQALKWSRPANDPQIVRQMIPGLKLIPPQKVRNEVDSMKSLWMDTYFSIILGEEKTRTWGIKAAIKNVPKY